jgi:6-phosphogluconolactonase
MSAPVPEIFSFADPEKLAAALASAIAGLLDQALAAENQSSLVVSGGTTPGPLFLRLRQQNLAWDKVYITLADERWVEPDDKDSNERLVRSLLLGDQAGQAHFVPLKNRAKTARAGEEECGRALAAIPRPFAAVVLGMGTDGHTASLFPGEERLALALDEDSGRECLAVVPPHARHERITLTLPAFLHADQIFLHLTGRDKKQALRRAMADGPDAEMPVRAILRQERVPVHIYWAP